MVPRGAGKEDKEDGVEGPQRMGVGQDSVEVEVIEDADASWEKDGQKCSWRGMN